MRKKIYVIQDASGWISDYFFTSPAKAGIRLAELSEKTDIYDLPLSIRVFENFDL